MPSKTIASVSLLAVVIGIGAAAVAIATVNGTTALTARIVLDRGRVRSGGAVLGWVIFENHTHRPKVLMRGCHANNMYAISFRPANGHGEGAPFTLNDGCRSEQSMVARPGRTTYRFNTPASYPVCGTGGGLPRCSKTASGTTAMPPLPPGRYTATFVANGRWDGPRVKPANLIVTAG